MRKEYSLIINSGKCYWGKCIFCGWGKKEFPKKSFEELKDLTIKKLKDKQIDRLKVFVSGSVLDENQIPFEYIEWLYGYAKEKGIKELVLETLPIFFAEEKARKLKELSDKYEIKTILAVGLEVADDEKLAKLNKPFRLKDYEEFVKRAKKYRFGIRTYLLVNAPFTTREDLDKSVEYAKNWSDEIVLINLYPHKDAPIIYVWLQCYRTRLFDYIKDNPELVKIFMKDIEGRLKPTN